ncbi:uncharacterized protein M6B38_278550 [Iris pallida]|uniref:Uncharacterized protein n=1 Tax=Iris pallida TaxID=29817 RepID=A0AAX6HYE4_IRIPA|nr:uncharacterized protein M6B38_278550 [Iris pallida]
MSLEENQESAGELLSRGSSKNGAKVFESKKEKRGKSVAGGFPADLSGTRRILRSHVAKLREAEDRMVVVEDGVGVANGTEEKQASEDACVGTDQNTRSCVINVRCEEEIIVESKYNMGSIEEDGSDNKGVAMGLAVEADRNVEEFVPVERSVAEEKKFGEEIEAGCFDDTRGAIGNSGSIAAQRNDQKIKRENIVLENKRITRSSASKQREEASQGFDRNGNSSRISGKEGIKVEKVSGSKIRKQREKSHNCEKKIKISKKRNTRSNVSGPTEEIDTVKKKKKLGEPGIKRRRQAYDADTGEKEIKTEHVICRQRQTGKLGGKKLKMALPINGEDGPSRKRMKRNLKKGEMIRCDKHLFQVKNNDFCLLKESHSTHNNKVQVKGRGRGSRLLLPSDKEGESEISHNDDSGKGQLNVKESSSLENKMSSGTRIYTKSSSRPKDPKDADASSNKAVVTVKTESETPGTKQSKEEERIERSMARKKLRDEIKSMLLSAGWKIDLRPRSGKKYLDAVYLSPKGHGYWSILKAYYVFRSQFSNEYNEKGNNLSGKSPRKKREASVSSFAPIPEEVLSILKHPISHRRSLKQLKEANLKLGIDSRSKGSKKNTSVKHQKYKHPKDNGGKAKRRDRKDEVLASSTKGAVGSAGKKQHPRKYRKKQKGCTLLVRGFSKHAENCTDTYVPYIWKRTILSWMIDLGIVPENAKVKYLNSQHTEMLLSGQITRDGIYCSCCNKILPVLEFETHAGSKLCHPYQNIFVEEEGISLLQCQVNAWEKQESELRGFCVVDTHGDDPNDDTCGICGDGGELICCDSCPSTFHQSCLGTEMLPPGNWYCMNCTCRYCGVNSSAVAQKNGEVVSPLLSCSQCEEKYHQMCVAEEHATRVSSNVLCTSFCGEDCKQLSEKLHMLVGVKNYLDGGFSTTLIRRFDEDLPNLFGLDLRAECNSKIAIALSVMDECFLPIIDQRSGINLIHNVVYSCGSNFNRLNYRGFYTFILERDDEIISVASVRLHGNRLAEMPFIGTRSMYRRQGMCRRLLNEVESALCSLNIERLIIPAISEMMDTWTNVFGFKHLETSEKQDLQSTNLLIFPATGLLLKPLQKNHSVEPCETSNQVAKHETEGVHHETPEATNSSCVYSAVEPDHCDSDVILQHKFEAEAENEHTTIPVSANLVNSTSDT